MKNEKRYAVTLDLYVYAETDEKAKEEAEFYKEHIELVADNKANIVSIHETPFGSIEEGRKLEKMFFATFGSGQLEDFDLLQEPTKTLVTIRGASEEQLREALFKSPIGSKFCTTYSEDYLNDFKDGKVVELKELMKSYKHRNMSLKDMRGY